MFEAVAGYQLDGQSVAPNIDAAFFTTSMNPLAVVTLRCTARRTVLFLVLETKDECKKWLPNWSTSSWNIQYKESLRWSASSMCWAVHGHQGSGACGFLSGVHGGIHPWLHDGPIPR